MTMETRDSKMSPSDLQRFCAEGYDLRYYLRKPWSRGNRTFATNGHILIHVPRLAEVPEDAKAPDTTRLLESAKTGKWRLVPETAMPPDVPCGWCHGSGKEMSDRRYKCEECDGTKTKPDHLTRTLVGPAAFANRYLALIQGWEIAPASESGAAPIRCGDAEGLLMPMRI